MLSILFVCTANRFRSPLAAAFFQQKLVEKGLDSKWSVASAGTWVLSGLPPLESALFEAHKKGLDISNHRSVSVEDPLPINFDLVIVMEMGQKEALRSEFPFLEGRIYLLTEIGGGIAYDIPDPVNTKESPSSIADEIAKQIDKRFPIIVKYLSYI